MPRSCRSYRRRKLRGGGDDLGGQPVARPSEDEIAVQAAQLGLLKETERPEETVHMAAPVPKPKEHAKALAALWAMDPERGARGTYLRLLRGDKAAQQEGEALMDEPERETITTMWEILTEIQKMRKSRSEPAKILEKVQEWENIKAPFAEEQRGKKLSASLFAGVRRRLPGAPKDTPSLLDELKEVDSPVAATAAAGKVGKMRKSQRRRKSTKRRRRINNKKYK